MNRFVTVIGLVLGTIMALSGGALAAPHLSPVTPSGRVYNYDTNMWQTPDGRPIIRPQDMAKGAHGGSAIPREEVAYPTHYKPGTIIVETAQRRLYFVLPGGKAEEYGIGVGREGFAWSGQHVITRKAEWPSWTPPAQMRRRVPDLPAFMPGGPDNPLGARALYIGNTLYRIHGTSEPWTIGKAVSSGCIRLTNDDIIDLFGRAKVGALVVVHQ